VRLLRQVERLEAAGAARAAEPAPVGLVWTVQERRVEAADLEPGQYIAADVEIVGHVAEVPLVRVTERITYDVADLGWIYRAEVDGEPLERIGRVVAVDGPMISSRMFAEPLPLLPAADSDAAV